MGPDSTLYDLASAVLDAIEGYYAAEGVDLPGRTYVSDGRPAHDLGDDEACAGEQVTVQVTRTLPVQGNVIAELASPFELGPQMAAAEVSIEVVRCAPVVEATGDSITVPSPEEIETSAQRVLSDAEMVPNALLWAWGREELPGCSGVAWMGWTSFGPDGGAVGGVTLLRISLA